MTVTYPLTFPVINSRRLIKKSTFRLQNVISESQSIFTGASQTYEHQGQWWEGEFTLVPMNRTDASEFIAFLAQLRGKFGTFLFGDPDYIALGPRGAGGGTPLVAGASQTGRTLNVDGFPALTAVYKKNDYFSLGTGTSTRLYMLTEDVTSDSAGAATLDFEPKLRVSPGNNDALTFTGATGIMKLSENIVEWSANESNIYNISFPFREALNI